MPSSPACARPNCAGCDGRTSTSSAAQSTYASALTASAQSGVPSRRKFPPGVLGIFEYVRDMDDLTLECGTPSGCASLRRQLQILHIFDVFVRVAVARGPYVFSALAAEQI